MQSQGKKPNSSAAERSGFFGGRLRIDETQATIILSDLHLEGSDPKAARAKGSKSSFSIALVSIMLGYDV